MTREEAIRWLICVKEEVDESEGTMIYISKKQADALGMAIEALSESKVHNMHSAVLISRQDAIEAVMAESRKVYTSEYASAERIIYEADAVEALAMLSSAEVVQGEWEHWGSPFSDESEVIDTIVCSVCGARFIEPKDEPKGEYNFCPNCGADNRKGKR